MSDRHDEIAILAVAAAAQSTMASDRDTPREAGIEKVRVALDWAGLPTTDAAILYDAGLRVEPDAGALRAALQAVRVLAPVAHLWEPDDSHRRTGGPVLGDFEMCEHPRCVAARAALASDTGGSSTAGNEP